MIIVFGFWLMCVAKAQIIDQKVCFVIKQYNDEHKCSILHFIPIKMKAPLLVMLYADISNAVVGGTLCHWMESRAISFPTRRI